MLAAPLLLVVWSGLPQQYATGLESRWAATAFYLPMTVMFGIGVMIWWDYMRHRPHWKFHWLVIAFPTAGAYVVIMISTGGEFDLGECKDWDGAIGWIAEQMILEHCATGVTWWYLASHYNYIHLAYGAYLGVVAGTGLFWLLPHLSHERTEHWAPALVRESLWVVRKTVWLLPVVFGLGLLTWVGFLFRDDPGGKESRVSAWLLYVVPAVLSLLVRSPMPSVEFVLLGITWIVGIVHAAISYVRWVRWYIRARKTSNRIMAVMAE